MASAEIATNYDDNDDDDNDDTDDDDENDDNFNQALIATLLVNGIADSIKRSGIASNESPVKTPAKAPKHPDEGPIEIPRKFLLLPKH